jgi:hypothetical protein
MEIGSTLERCESALASPDPLDLTELGFWKAVAALKRNPGLVQQYRDRVAVIDQAAFLRWAPVRIPIRVGVAAMALLTAAGLAIISLAYFVDAPWNGIWLLTGTGVLLGSTHTLAHFVVGRMVGIRFTYWFIGNTPQPGVKIDYASYLTTPPRARAWMHASGALTTKAIPFLSLGAAWGSGSPVWTMWTLGGLGVVMIATDLLFSVKQSDWKKFRREMRYVS